LLAQKFFFSNKGLGESGASTLDFGYPAYDELNQGVDHVYIGAEFMIWLEITSQPSMPSWQHHIRGMFFLSE
jgi:hypothetical protein